MFYLLLEDHRMEWITKLCSTLELDLHWSQQVLTPPHPTAHKPTLAVIELGQQ
jgi:hypothetical protein